MRKVLLFALSLSVPFAVAAADTPVTRRDGFLQVWATIKRPVEDVRVKRYDDVPEGAVGEREISFAKYRGLLGDVPAFRPDQPLLLQDAIVWLLKTRNVTKPEEISSATLAPWLKKYPLKIDEKLLASPITAERLKALIDEFDTLMKEEVHLVTNYGAELHGNGTAFGETFDMYAMTAAHKFLPYNTMIKVTDVETGLSVVVRINDRGPYVEGRDLDLSAAAFQKITNGGSGVRKMRIERLGDVSMVGPCYREPSYQKSIGSVTLNPGVPTVLPLGQSVTIGSDRALLLHSIKTPTETLSLESWVASGEPYVFTPKDAGRYYFQLANTDGRNRRFITTVVQCDAS